MTNFSDAPIPGTPSGTPSPNGALIPGQPSQIPGLPSQLRTAEPNTASIFSSNQLNLRSGFIGVSWRGFFELQNNGRRWTQALADQRKAICRKLAAAMQDWARENARWQDRTGDARRGLEGEYVEESGPGMSAAVIAHTVDYGQYLESMQGGQYAIILPTLLHFAAELGQFEVAAGFEFAGA